MQKAPRAPFRAPAPDHVRAWTVYTSRCMLNTQLLRMKSNPTPIPPPRAAIYTILAVTVRVTLATRTAQRAIQATCFHRGAGGRSVWALGTRRSCNSHSAPFFAVLKQFWQSLLKEEEDELYTDYFMSTTSCFYIQFPLITTSCKLRGPFLTLRSEPQGFGFPAGRTPDDNPAPRLKGVQTMTDVALVPWQGAHECPGGCSVILPCVRWWSVANQRRIRFCRRERRCAAIAVPC